MTDSEIYDLIDATNMALADATDRIEALEKRVKALESGQVPEPVRAEDGTTS
jgi:hypothetical protein